MGRGGWKLKMKHDIDLDFKDENKNNYKSQVCWSSCCKNGSNYEKKLWNGKKVWNIIKNFLNSQVFEIVVKVVKNIRKYV